MFIVGLAFAASTPSSYYVSGPTNDYSLKKKLQSVNQHTVTSEDKETVLNATTGHSDQIGAGSQAHSYDEAFNSPMMCVTEEVLEPVASKSKAKRTNKKCKKLTQICVK